jgi:hypothetical protein
VRLTLPEWAGALLVLAGLLALWLWRGALVRDVLAPLIIILTYLGVVLWFQRRQQPGSLLSGRGAPPSLAWLGGAAVLFLAAGGLAHRMPPPTTGDDLSPLSVLTLFFGVFGMVWLPVVSLVLGVRAYRQSVRTGGKLQ